ncbi:unnamed protein product [Linum trigynum]|uniref:Pre-mRNA-splicing factor SLU7 n=1 Tax=Linum trigynum TaxID=586398 RepID=A0AAV2GB84_9ROSI
MAIKSREDYRKQKELEEARKAGLVHPEVDEDGNEINPHIPHYMASAPWYLNPEKKLPGLKHQRKRKNPSDAPPIHNTESAWYDRGAKVFQAEKYRKGACENCGAMSHDAKACVERPRKSGAKWTNKHIASDETIEHNYASKRDRWNGYDTARYDRDVVARDLRVDESEQMDCFGKVEKRVRSGGGGSTGTVRNLRIREDKAKYLLNLGAESAHYDPKTRSMRGDPLPDADPNDKFYWGDNRYRDSGEAGELKQLESRLSRGEEGHLLQAAPTQAELLYRNFQVKRKELEARAKDDLLEKYGNAAANSRDGIPREVLLGQSERQDEYDRAGRVVREGCADVQLPRSKQTIRNSYCTGTAGIKAAET